MNRDEAFKEYEETLDKINQQARMDRNFAFITLREQLKALRIEHHSERLRNKSFNRIQDK